MIRTHWVGSRSRHDAQMPCIGIKVACRCVQNALVTFIALHVMEPDCDTIVTGGMALPSYAISLGAAMSRAGGSWGSENLEGCYSIGRKTDSFR